MALLLMQAAPEHTTHVARHGGQFFTAAGDTVHVEGTWPVPRVFKLYLYDQQSKPLPLERLREIGGRVTANAVTSALVLHDEGYFEARLPNLRSRAAEIHVDLRLSKGAGAEAFVFRFPALSDEGASAPGAATSIPQTLAATLAALRADIAEADRLMQLRESAFVAAPAMRVRDHALSLERFLPPPGDRRARAETGIREIVRIAWLLQGATEQGTLDQTNGALDELELAVDDVAAAFAGGTQ